MTSRLMSLLIWAAVAASAVYWGLRLFSHATPVPGGAVVAMAQAPAAGNLARLLGTPPVQPVAEAAVLPADSRFKLLGVVAPRGGADRGLALISIDGKPARAVPVGRELEPGLRLLTVSHRQAELGTARGAPAITLALPALAAPNRGRPGELAAPGAAAMGQPGAGGQAMPFGNPPGGLPGQMRLPGNPNLPGMPIQPPEMPQGAQPDNGTAPTS